MVPPIVTGNVEPWVRSRPWNMGPFSPQQCKIILKTMFLDPVVPGTWWLRSHPKWMQRCTSDQWKGMVPFAVGRCGAVGALKRSFPRREAITGNSPPLLQGRSNFVLHVTVNLLEATHKKKTYWRRCHSKRCKVIMIMDWLDGSQAHSTPIMVRSGAIKVFPTHRKSWHLEIFNRVCSTKRVQRWQFLVI
jgi:hypothetical protein